jgi:hypothetical protein
MPERAGLENYRFLTQCWAATNGRFYWIFVRRKGEGFLIRRFSDDSTFLARFASTSEIEHPPRFVLERRGRLGSSETSWKKAHRDFLETLVRAMTGGIVEPNRHLKLPESQNAIREALSRHAEIL